MSAAMRSPYPPPHRPPVRRGGRHSPGRRVEAAAAPGGSASTWRRWPTATASSPTSSNARSPRYRGWRWAATLTRASRAKTSPWTKRSCCPARTRSSRPEWVPWSERLRPGDLGPATCCPPRRRTCAWSPATRARTRRRRTPPVRGDGRLGGRGSGGAAGRRTGGRGAGARSTQKARRLRSAATIAAVAEEMGMAPAPGALPLRAAHRRRPLGGRVRAPRRRWRRPLPRAA